MSIKSTPRSRRLFASPVATVKPEKLDLLISIRVFNTIEIGVLRRSVLD